MSLSYIWAATVLLAWFFVSVRLGQHLLAGHPSHSLVAFGAFKGSSLRVSGAWQLIASQWQHVHFAHMLLNCAIIAIVGGVLEGGVLGQGVVLLGIIGGAIGQLADALTQPDGFISGASGASMTLVGLALLLLPLRSRGWVVALIGLVIALALDLGVTEGHFVKAGHLAPLVLGAIVGLLVRRHGSVDNYASLS